MSGGVWFVDEFYDPSGGNGTSNLTRRTTVAPLLVADTAEPLAAEAGRPIPEPDRDDSDMVPHG